MMPTAQMAPLFVVLLLTPGVAADDGLRRVPLAVGPGPYVGRSGADLLLNSSQPAGAVLLNGRDIVSDSFPPVRVLLSCVHSGDWPTRSQLWMTVLQYVFYVHGVDLGD